MSVSKRLLFGGLIAAVFSAISIPTASANFELTLIPCGKEGRFVVNFCWERKGENNLKELKGEERFTMTLDEGEALFEIAQLRLHIVCREARGEGTAVQTFPLETDYTLLNLVIRFTGCIVLESACRVAEVLTRPLKGDPVNDERNILEEEPVTFAAEEGEVVTEVVVMGCAQEGRYVITGKQQCLWVEPLVDLLEHLLHCLHTESLLMLNGLRVTFEALFRFRFNNLGEDLWDVVELE